MHMINDKKKTDGLKQCFVLRRDIDDNVSEDDRLVANWDATVESNISVESMAP